MVFEWDDFGASHIISGQCQSHDCRDQLLKLKEANPKFKATLFAIPGEMTQELLDWYWLNASWIELAVHGFFHSDNWECEKLSYEDFAGLMLKFTDIIQPNFQRIFRAPGWQISDGAFKWLKDNDWVVADQGYNDNRRPDGLKAFINYDGKFVGKTFKFDDSLGYEIPYLREVEAYHGHTWDVGWNGIYEDFEKVLDLVKQTDNFKFVSEVMV